MRIIEIDDDLWKIYDNDCSLQYIDIIQYQGRWRVSFKSFNGKRISVKDFKTADAAKNFLERFIDLLNNHEL